MSRYFNLNWVSKPRQVMQFFLLLFNALFKTIKLVWDHQDFYCSLKKDKVTTVAWPFCDYMMYFCKLCMLLYCISMWNTNAYNLAWNTNEKCRSALLYFCFVMECYKSRFLKKEMYSQVIGLDFSVISTIYQPETALVVVRVSELRSVSSFYYQDSIRPLKSLRCIYKSHK